VVNIDNGLGAAAAAHRLLTRLRLSHEATTKLQTQTHEETVAR